MRTILPLLFLAFAAVGSAGTVANGKTALVIIDVQNFYFPGGQLPLDGPEAASRNVRRLLDAFRAHGWPVIHVQHLPKDQAQPSPSSGNPQYQIHADVMPVTGETVIGKHYANAFRDTDLLKVLRERGITSLVICGMQTQMCVEATTRAAADLGFDVTVVDDACASRPLTFGGLEVPARYVHAAALATMQGTYAKVMSTAEWLAQNAPAGSAGSAPPAPSAPPQ
jgi:nicotinamidase-related amidase